MAEHTPGPWEATHRLSSIGDPLKNGRFVILQRGSNKKEDFFICEMPFAVVRGGDARECEANARLIAAAPELLAALESIRDAGLGGYLTPELCADIVTAAIDGAKGSQS